MSIHSTLSFHEEAAFGTETGSADSEQVAFLITTVSASAALTPGNS